ncbi:site-specific integrase [Streptomyces sp. NA04227]|uniref:tyrosine-type recombinase/integrase n=1 Tax=Streptomyces sp. NA04227 TaxID=2742136 RepID=UPI0015924029|nr:site-specific integrase [Streptomyces sp. NA04227]QKW07018.1 site-specific integrase [Streptomyces sp. NA04227]
MAYVQPLKNKHGEVTSYRVKWRAGGARDGDWQGERFDDETSAGVFKDAVDEAGQQWPAGWVKGQGYVDQNAADPDEKRYRFREFATNLVENKTGIEEHYRQACFRDLDRYVHPTFGECDVRSTEHFSKDTVRAWVRKLEKTKVHRGQVPKTGTGKLRPMSPKTIRNLHGLLSNILDEAVKAEPPLRARNPCEGTRLPRADDDGGEDGEDVEFLTPDEVAGVISCLERRSDQLLAQVKYGTGMRWSEVTCLAPECLIDWDTAEPKIKVKRAWKRDGAGGYKVGIPKSKRSRRTIRVSWGVVEAANELGGDDREHPTRLYFTGEQGQRLHYSTFHGRWQRAVKRAKAQGLLSRQKRPTPHDLRHSHAAVLLSEGRGLTYVQRRLGHESIKTTSDTYGHLLPEADDAAMDIIDRSLGRGGPGVVDEVLAADAATGDRSRVHVVHFDGEFSTHVEAFWKRGDAKAVADQWQIDHPDDTVRVETMAADWWRRQQTNGLKDVREGMPGRARVWWGGALYNADGSELRTGVDLEDVAARWVWEWEERYTEKDAVSRVRHEDGIAALTRAEAWGVDLEKVQESFARAREEALAACAAHPALSVGGGFAEDSPVE